MHQPIEDYGVIGDLNTVALVGMDGSIDFMCFPNFDSPSVFAALLDREKGGKFQIAPNLSEARKKQLYLPDSNILLTRFLSREGVGEVSDFMTVGDETPGHVLVRRVKAVRGSVRFEMTLAPRFNYARSPHTVRREGNGLIFESDGDDRTVLRLQTTVPLEIREGDAVAQFTLESDQHACFVLDAPKMGCEGAADLELFVAEQFKTTLNYWRSWIHKSTYKGRWRETMNRSALVLKLLTSAQHGSIVAAPTFGLPEEIGGIRNWDYRYVWIRDASFTLYALMRLGFVEEAQSFMNWIEHRCEELEPDGSLQIMYALDGHHDLTEVELPHLSGYRGSKPVRIGNDAYSQLQLDIYGELMDSVYIFNKFGQQISYDLWRNLVRLVNWVCDHWQLADEGIWEIRGKRREFLFSRLMCWVAVDRGLRLADKRSFPAPRERWTKVRDEIYHDIFNNFWNADLKSFVQFKQGKSLDASCLLMPLVKFISPTDTRWLSTMDAIQSELVDDSLIYRYNAQLFDLDGLPGLEGSFNMCTFWYIECLARSGDVHRSRFLFDKMLGYANHLGLYAEELGTSGEHLGNFPQAFTHLSLISAAYNLNRALDAHHVD